MSASAFELEMIARVTSAQLAQRSAIVALLVALGEAGAVDPNRVLQFVETFAAALRQPVGVKDEASLRAMELAAGELDALRPAMLDARNLPPGAGRA